MICHLTTLNRVLTLKNLYAMFTMIGIRRGFRMPDQSCQLKTMSLEYSIIINNSVVVRIVEIFSFRIFFSNGLLDFFFSSRNLLYFRSYQESYSDMGSTTSDPPQKIKFILWIIENPFRLLAWQLDKVWKVFYCRSYNKFIDKVYYRWTIGL